VALPIEEHAIVQADQLTIYSVLSSGLAMSGSWTIHRPVSFDSRVVNSKWHIAIRCSKIKRSASR
jgi:hypothetical protein